ncbi:hypothetical protein HPB51_000677 [Rhipicephalus microplus]|uniref:Fringe-like glycosyltransferase domain-containing protein n=1 Tax=Rhipicephalus microplus TaxID=6941 RepID=A0A9J6EQ24_RHIMP|nr:hypothetical protein HPB51_000677 [Rhipicephalus microplus]
MARARSTLSIERTYFFTDASDPLYQLKTNGHLINTNCSSSHNRKALCCKMSVELDFFLDSNKKWMCHFDDDNYVNVPRLVKLLQEYDPREDWYLGKPSIRQPLEILARDSTKPQRKIAFWFATGGAGFCISRSLALKMLPLAGHARNCPVVSHELCYGHSVLPTWEPCPAHDETLGSRPPSCPRWCDVIPPASGFEL